MTRAYSSNKISVIGVDALPKHCIDLVLPEYAGRGPESLDIDAFLIKLQSVINTTPW